MGDFSKYFNDDFKDLEPISKNINELLKDPMFLISGDFYGIQKFIFENLSSKNAAKVLRAKSAFCELFITVLAKFICHKLNINEKYILSCTAGKFEILSPKFDQIIFDEIKDIINSYFIKNFFGISGISLSFVECKKEDFSESLNYKNLRDKISKMVELEKFKKLDLPLQNPILEYDKSITNQTLCRICNIRKVNHDDKCDICNCFVRLGEILVSNEKNICSKEIGIDFFDTNLDINEHIKSYVAKDKNSIVEFDTLSKRSCGENCIAVIKADVDNMGNFIKKSDVTDSFTNFDIFSKSINNFFSLYVPRKMKEKFEDSYTVFSGGDDLLIVGRYDQMIDLAIFIRQEFMKFIKNKELSISFGVVLAKPSTPISYLANMSEFCLEKSKEMDGKDSISIFGETAKWDSYIEIRDMIMNEFEKFESYINTAFLYRLLELCEMSKNVKDDVKNTIWKSKLSYSFNRNMQSYDKNFLLMLNEVIENNPKESKMAICEYIYKRRER
ncbi:hypothetical protein [Campylobacter sp. RM15925]|uniref:type III-A CRISPR-associated protein Cas10/Csm1 n=1 Tax=Campylobacter sp. RM15925 TaxID=1705724 RepID=UPI001473CAFB|nr:hypothetical protein [Campylobacter sp. RM15925]